jgi:hypothetical protein
MSDLEKFSDWQLQELEHYARLERLRRERGEAIAKDDFVSWAKATLKIGVEYIDHAWNWLIHQLGLR